MYDARRRVLGLIVSCCTSFGDGSGDDRVPPVRCDCIGNGRAGCWRQPGLPRGFGGVGQWSELVPEEEYHRVQGGGVIGAGGGGAKPAREMSLDDTWTE